MTLNCVFYDTATGELGSVNQHDHAWVYPWTHEFPSIYPSNPLVYRWNPLVYQWNPVGLPRNVIGISMEFYGHTHGFHGYTHGIHGYMHVQFMVGWA